MSDVPAGSEPLEIQPGEPGYLAAYWKAELHRAEEAFKAWSDDAKKVEDRYALEGDKMRGGTRINLLWSNVETLAPALYASPPKMVATRRFLDRDPIGRVACRIIQRAVQYKIDGGEIHEATKAAVLDRLLCGRGQVWVRYEPTIEGGEIADDLEAEFDGIEGHPGAGDAEDAGGEGALPPTADSADAGGEPDAAEPAVLEPRITAEVCHVDHVNRADFLHDPARSWREVRWVARRSYLTKGEVQKRFPEVADMVPLNRGPSGEKDERNAANEHMRKAEVWEIWDRDTRDVVWISPGCERHLDKRPDMYGLEDFFPCPKPLFATVTNRSLVPVPDFRQYETQADQLDTIADREDDLTEAMRVRGGYDASVPELARILKASENQLVPVDAMMTQFAQGGAGSGLASAVQFLPLDVFAKGLEALARRKQEVKADAFEVTGMSDILRGQGDAGETATGVQTKGHFATLRLKADQGEVARFVRDVVRIMAEMTCELFQPETLGEMTSAYEMDELQVPAPMPALPPPGGGMGMSSPQPAPMAPAGPPMMPPRLPMMAGPMTAGQGRP